VSHSNLESVRLLTGDTDVSDALLSDAEITNLLEDRTVLNDSGGTVSVNVPAAAADAAGAIAAKFARQFDFSEDSQRFDRSQRYSHYIALEQRLRTRQGGAWEPAGTATVF
jgi:hypothetical protein